MDDELLVTLANATRPTLIKVIGVGGGGGNAVAQMYREHIEGVRMLVCNTDKKALEDNPVPDHLQLGPGLGAGGDPEKGLAIAEENVEAIRQQLDADTHMVFITAGMGGGTGTGVSPVIAREARAKGILTVGIVTIPFLFEREKRIDKALDGLESLAKEVDAILVINNQRLCDIYSDLSIINAFRKADQTLTTAVRSITEIITMHGRINLDFCDVSTVLTNGGVAVISTGYGEGPGRVKKAIDNALNSPLLNNNDVYRSERILISISFNDTPDTALLTEEINELNVFMQHFDSQVETKFGLSTDSSLGSKVKITILASGFSLYGKDKKRPIADTLPSAASAEEELKRQGERDRFYGSAASKRTKHHRVYLFSPQELLTDGQLLDEVENTPTYLRSAAAFSHLCQTAENERLHKTPASTGHRHEQTQSAASGTDQ